MITLKTGRTQKKLIKHVKTGFQDLRLCNVPNVSIMQNSFDEINSLMESGLNKNAWRKAFLLGRTNGLISSHISSILFRSSHNSLYQMVKKRTLEARNKKQTSNDPCTIQASPHSSFQNEEGQKVCVNTEILRAHSFSCSSSMRNAPPTSGKSYGNIPGPGQTYSNAQTSSQPYSHASHPSQTYSNATNPSQRSNNNPPPSPQTSSKSYSHASSPSRSHNPPPSKTYGSSPAPSKTYASAAPSQKVKIEDPCTTCYPEEEDVRGGFYQEQIPIKAAEERGLPACRPKRSQGPCKEDRDPCARQSCKDDKKDYCKRGGMAKPPPPPCPFDWKKFLLALLAGLGLGGLLFWLFFRKSDDDSDGEEKDECIKSTDLPKHVPYLLIGGGAASFSAFRSIKANHPTAKILMITNEWRKPYMRPPLSKELWYTAQSSDIDKDLRFKQWTGSERSLYFESTPFFVSPKHLMDSPGGGLAVAHGFTVKKIDPKKKVAILADGYEIEYDECLIATGCSPKNLHVFRDAPPGVRDKVMVYRTPEDFERLKRYADEKKSIAIIGNGFIGSELACSLAKYGNDKGVRVYQIFPEAGNMSRTLPDYLSCWTMRKIEDLGVCVLPNSRIRSAERDEEHLKIHLNTGKTVLTDVAVVCVGCDPNTALATTSGLEVDRTLGGFLVNSELEARTHLYAAGDAACFYDPVLGRRRVEHHDHSIVSGRLAGENMVGKKKPYEYQSMFWSDLGPDIGYESIGLVDSSLPTVGVFAMPNTSGRSGDNLDEKKAAAHIEDPKREQLPIPDGPDITCEEADDYGRGVIFYLKNDKVVGILLWNLFNRIGLARTIINQNKKYDDLNEVAKLFEIHS